METFKKHKNNEKEPATLKVKLTSKVHAMSVILATLKHSKKSAHQIHLPLSPVFHFPLELLVDLLKKKSLVYVGKE
jgi:hypothetical protein